MRIRTKSQMEILGLAILFVLLIFGFLFFIMFTSGEKSDTREEFLQPKMASSILTSMLKTSMKCGDAVYSVTDLLKDCGDVTLRLIYCGNYEFHDSNNDQAIQSCGIDKDMIEEMLASTMDVYDREYWMKAYTSSQEIFEIQAIDSECTENSPQKSPAHQPFELTTDTLNIGFGICS